MKRTAIYRTWALGLFAALALLPATTHGQAHFGPMFVSLSGPNGNSVKPRAHVGETVNVHFVVTNMDEFYHPIAVSSASLVIHHGTGDVIVPNLTPDPVILPVYGDNADISTNFVVKPEDGDILRVDGELHVTDDWDFSIHTLSWMQLEILKPAMEVSQQCEVSPASSVVIFRGSVTNTGNTPLSNVVVESDNGTPEYAADDSTIQIGPLNTNASAPYLGIYTSTGSSFRNTVTVRATDALGLTVSHSTNSTIPGTDSPVLQIARASEKAIRVSWPEWAEGFLLESCEALRPSRTWTAVTNTPVASDGEFSVTLGISGAAHFYRLAR